MTFPIKAEHAESIADQLIARGNALKQLTDAWIARCDTGTIQLHSLVSVLLAQLVDHKARWDVAALVPGVGAAVEARYPNKVFSGDVAIAEISTAMGVLVTFVVTQIPKESTTNRWLDTIELDGNGRMVERTTANAPAIALLRAELVTFRAAFDVS